MRGLIGPLGRVALVAVVAILLADCLAAPAAARTRDDGVQEANDFIEACVRMGGEPEVIEASDEWIITSCRLPNGDNFQCDWSPGGDWSQHCHLFHSVPGGVRPVFEQVQPGPIEGVFVEEEPAPVRPQAGYDVLPIGTLTEADASPAPLPAAGGESGRIIVRGGSALVPADEAAGGRVTVGERTTDPAPVPPPGPLAGVVTTPVEEPDAEVTTELVPEEITLPVEETDAEVTTELLPEEITLPVEETDAPVTTETWVSTLPVEEPEEEVTTEQAEATLPVEETDAEVTTEQWATTPVEETDAPVTTQPAPAAGEQP